MRQSRLRIDMFLIIALVTGVFARPATAEERPTQLRHWGFNWTLGSGSVSGDYGEILEKPIAWDYSLFRELGAWRVGGGVSFASMKMKPPYEDEKVWGHQEIFGYGTRVFRRGSTISPYLQLRASIVRIHPQADSTSLFATIPEDEIEVGDSRSEAANGVGVTFIPGFETAITRDLSFDIAGYVNLYTTGEYDLTPIGKTDPAKTGNEMGARMGLTWRPSNLSPHPRWSSSPADTMPLDPENEYRDAWGVTRSYGWATAEVLAINYGASAFNEYVRNANFNQVSPRSFWDNLEHGWTWDDNEFRTNQVIHPFNGSTYYSSARANGLGFWTSSLFALGGAFMWEAAGETHPMSFNDQISTGVGGIAFGESMYRLSSAILDNTKIGSGRTWREIGSFLVNPIRGFNRFLSGQASRQTGNPASPYDRNPPRYGTFVAAGGRMMGEGESISDSTRTGAFLEISVDHGSPWENERRRPFDHFDTDIQFNTDDKAPLARLQIRGDLFSKAFGEGTGSKHAIAFTQYFDYVNNESYEFGGQSFGAAFFSRFRPSSHMSLRTRVDGTVMVLGAVNSDYAFLAEVADQERYREYDYGPGLGGSAEVAATFSNRAMLAMQYRFQWISTKNGSVFNTEKYGGSDANHYVQAAGLRATYPIGGGASAGLDGIVFLRDSFYSSTYLKDVRQRNPQLRAYLAWSMDR